MGANRTFGVVFNNEIREKVAAPATPTYGPPAWVVDLTDLNPLPEVGWKLVDGAWVSPQALPPTLPRPKIVLMEATVSGPHSAMGRVDMNAQEITIIQGDAIHVTGELQVMGKKIPYSGAFRMPVRKSDGTEPDLAAAFITAGAVSVAWAPEQRGIYSITADLLNRELPPDVHMDFDGIRIFVMAPPVPPPA